MKIFCNSPSLVYQMVRIYQPELNLYVCKTKELIQLKKNENRQHHQSSKITGLNCFLLQICVFLLISNKTNVNAVFKNDSPGCSFFLRELKSLQVFYQSFVASALFHVVVSSLIRDQRDQTIRRCDVFCDIGCIFYLKSLKSRLRVYTTKFVINIMRIYFNVYHLLSRIFICSN